jgi:hypothetical protein
MKHLKQKFVDQMIASTEKMVALVTEADKQQVAEELSVVYKNYLEFRELTLSHEEKELNGLRLIENRYNRSKRLIDLGAPRIIQENEFTWLLTMVNYLNNALNGIEPLMPKDREEELNEQIKMED